MLCFLPGSSFPKTQITNIDLLVHFSFYGVFSFLLILGNVRQSQFLILKNKPVLWALIVSILFGGMIEIIQGTKFVSRSTELSDFIANSIGSFIGWILFLIIYGSPKKYSSWNKKKTLEKITEKDQANIS